MTNSNKAFWSPKQVYDYLSKQSSKKQPMILPNNAYCTENFTWNEVLRTKPRKISLPSMEILENLKANTEVLQVYRTKIGKKIDITSSWRTPTEQKELIQQYKAGLLENMPSETSLHLEGLALDFKIKEGGQQPIHGIIDKSLIGEMEPGWNYTHLGLPTFSKSYLQRHGIYRDDIYRKLYIDPSKLTAKEREVLIKRINPKNWHSIPDKFVPATNAEFFKNSNIGKNDVEPTPKLPEVKTPLPNENKTEDNVVDVAGNSIDVENGRKPYLEGHVEINVPKDETLSDIEQGQLSGYAAKISEKTQAEGQKDDDNLPTWEKPLEGYEEPNVYYDGKKYTFDGELSDEVISKMNIHEKMAYYTKYLKHYYIKRLKTLAKEQEQRDRLGIIRQQEIQRQKEFEEEYWSPEEIREEVEEYLSWVFTQTARTMGYL